jgi:hypothetical protein
VLQDSVRFDFDDEKQPLLVHPIGCGQSAISSLGSSRPKAITGNDPNRFGRARRAQPRKTALRPQGTDPKNLVKLVGAVAEQDGARSLREDLKIKPEGPAAGVLQIQADHIIKAHSAAALHLP